MYISCICSKHPTVENTCVPFIITSCVWDFHLLLTFSWLNNHSFNLSSYVRFSCLTMRLIGLCWTFFIFSASFSDWLASHSILKVNHPFSLWEEKNRCSKASAHFEIWQSLSDWFCYFFVIFLFWCKVLHQKSGFFKAAKLRMLLIQGLLQLEILR